MELNPWPGSRVKNNAAKCSIRNQAVGKNRKHVKCEVYQRLTHVSCLNISKIQQINYTVKTIPLYSCSACTLTELPFYNKRNLNETIDNETQITPPSRDFHIDKLQANFNINLLSHQNESTNRYKNILHTFSWKHMSLNRQEKVKHLFIIKALTSLLNWYIVTSSAPMKFQTTISHMQFSVLKKNAFKNDTNVYEMRKT